MTTQLERESESSFQTSRCSSSIGAVGARRAIRAAGASPRAQYTHQGRYYLTGARKRRSTLWGLGSPARTAARANRVLPCDPRPNTRSGVHLMMEVRGSRHGRRARIRRRAAACWKKNKIKRLLRLEEHSPEWATRFEMADGLARRRGRRRLAPDAPRAKERGRRRPKSGGAEARPMTRAARRPRRAAPRGGDGDAQPGERVLDHRRRRSSSLAGCGHGSCVRLFK